ncbi:MAG: hypothetical protein GHHEDOFH_01725 [Pseudorhodoplanes sp.]|nr:hypothetical protein [Pseudorhodoplanes sp.]
MDDGLGLDGPLLRDDGRGQRWRRRSRRGRGLVRPDDDGAHLLRLGGGGRRCGGRLGRARGSGRREGCGGRRGRRRTGGRIRQDDARRRRRGLYVERLFFTRDQTLGLRAVADAVVNELAGIGFGRGRRGRNLGRSRTGLDDRRRRRHARAAEQHAIAERPGRAEHRQRDHRHDRQHAAAPAARFVFFIEFVGVFPRRHGVVVAILAAMAVALAHRAVAAAIGRALVAPREAVVIAALPRIAVRQAIIAGAGPAAIRIEARSRRGRTVIGKLVLHAIDRARIGGRRHARIDRRLGPLHRMGGVTRIVSARIGGRRRRRLRRLRVLARKVGEGIVPDQARKLGKRIAAIDRCRGTGTRRGRLTLEIGCARGSLVTVVRHVRFCDLSCVHNRFVGV